MSEMELSVMVVIIMMCQRIVFRAIHGFNNKEDARVKKRRS